MGNFSVVPSGLFDGECQPRTTSWAWSFYIFQALPHGTPGRCGTAESWQDRTHAVRYDVHSSPAPELRQLFVA